MDDMTESTSTNINDVISNGRELEVFEDHAKTGRTLNNIEKNLEYQLKEELKTNIPENTEYYEDTMHNKTESILKIHGLSQSQFDFMGSAENLINATILNDTSIDANANKSEKTVESIMQEAMAPMKKAIGYDELYRQMKKDWGKEEAKRLSGEMYSFALALADSTAILKPYCFSIDARRLVLEGRSFGQLYSKPSKRVTSYISALCETIHQLSNHLAGAVAIGTFFFDIAHVLLYTDTTYRDDNSSTEPDALEELQTDKRLRKYIENEFQQFVHSVNHLSRNASESPFTNISIFDKAKIKTLLDGEQLMSYYPGMDENYVIDYVYEIQKIFIDFFDKGDPTTGGMPYRFPIVTLNLSKDDDGKILDPEFEDYVCNKDIYRYNIFASKGTKLASCCFKGSTEINISVKDNHNIPKTMTVNFKDFYETPYIDAGIEVNSYGDINKHFNTKFDKLCLPYTDPWVVITTGDGVETYYTKDHLIPTRRGCIKAEDVTEDDVIKIDIPTYCPSSNSKKEIEKYNNTIKHIINVKNNVNYINISSIRKEENTDGKAYCVRMHNTEDQYFKLINGVITHNCRLINDVDTMREYASQSNSFGGVGISLGSHRVVTINFNRIALEASNKDEYFKILDQRIIDTSMILKSHKNLLQMLADKGMQLFISNGWIPMNKLFSTFGILGLVEANEYVKQNYPEYKDNDKDFMKDALVYLNKRMIEESRKLGIIGNIEQIPAESMAVRLAKADRILFGEEKVPYKLYANQFIPLWKEASIWKKMMKDGYYNQLITGGGIVHAQIGERVTPKQAKSIIEFSIKSGCEHFALNAVYSVCDHGHTTFGKQKTCPICGSQNVDHYTRVVGFFTKVENWNPVRRDWEFDRRTFVTLPKDETDVPEVDKSKISKHISVKEVEKEDSEETCESCKVPVSTDEPTSTSLEIQKYNASLLDNDIILFTLPTCHRCPAVKEKLSQTKIKYAVVCADNDKTMEFMQNLGIMSTPTIWVKSKALLESDLDKINTIIDEIK